VLAALAAIQGCGEATASRPQANPPPAPSLSSGTRAERFFPLIDGHVYEYRTRDEHGGEGLLIARVARMDATHGELRYGSRPKRFVYSAEGVRLDGPEGAFLLKEPIAVGASWSGQGGAVVRITSTTASVHTMAGDFDGCVETLEERPGASALRVTTTFCPALGMARLVAQRGVSSERAELKSYGAEVTIGPGGTFRSP
jgi:hypothetical protein